MKIKITDLEITEKNTGISHKLEINIELGEQGKELLNQLTKLLTTLHKKIHEAK